MTIVFLMRCLRLVLLSMDLVHWLSPLRSTAPEGPGRETKDVPRGRKDRERRDAQHAGAEEAGGQGSDVAVTAPHTLSA